MMFTAVFDIGGVLRTIHLSSAPAAVKNRNYPAMRELYKALAASPAWRVVVVTMKPKDVTEEQTRRELEVFGLPQPDELVVLHGGSKGPVYERLKADIVFEDEQRWVDAATKAGAVGALIT